MRSVARALFVLAVLMTLVPCGLAEDVPIDDAMMRSPDSPLYPLKASANNRYLVDQNNSPFLMVGDSPQNLITNLSQKEAAAFMDNRRSYGINALWIDLLCIFTDPSCNKEARTFDGIIPFLVPGDIATPNPEYFQRVEDILRIAMDHGMIVLLDPIETSSWLDILRNNGESRAFKYGQYLANRYKFFPNIIWMHGNDFQSWRNSTDTALVQAVARGIRSVDKAHIHTLELDYFSSGSLDDPQWATLLELDAAYTYFPTFAQVLIEYNRSDFKPIFMVEANYEFEHNFNATGGSINNLRRQEYWTMLSGATGQLYGSAYTWRLNKGWETTLDTPGVLQLKYMKGLFANRKWYDLVPDQNHTVMTDGYGVLSCLAGKASARFGKNGNFMGRVLHLLRNYAFIASNSCAVAARNPDGSLALAYMPTIRTITIDMSKVASPATARWYDPTSGEYADVKGSPFANAGSRQFTPSKPNKSGEGDWVLVLESRSPR
jgi:Protein of unknown function (DUF4038)/Putative collagen-binding domain of a collagenase